MNYKTHILVVDDEKVVRDGCSKVLTGRGYEVYTAENGEQAIYMLKDKNIDLILLDLKMPGMSGEELLEIVVNKYPDLPVIIITGHGTVDTAVECMKKGAYDFITKPFQIDQFLLTISRAAEKRRLEKQARQLEEERSKNLYDLSLEKSRLKTIINCMANGVMVTNRALEVVLHNPALMRMMEIKGELESPIPINKVINNETLIHTLKGIIDTNVKKNEAFSQELSIGNKYIRAISAAALGPDNNIVGTVTVLEDITPFKRLDEMKTDFINMVVHELRSPLVAIRQMNSVLLEELAGPLNEKQKDFVNREISRIDELLNLINDLLDVAKIEAGRYVQHLVPTDICKIVEKVVSLMQERARNQGIDLLYSCENVGLVSADPESIEEVFNNLISNAINYSPDGGKVVVLVKGRGEYIEIKVSDTGIGIPREEIPKIFDKFYRVKDSKTRRVTGTGLGLYIVKNIIDAHKGSINVESEVGKGTTFVIFLPMAK